MAGIVAPPAESALTSYCPKSFRHCTPGFPDASRTQPLSMQAVSIKPPGDTSLGDTCGLGQSGPRRVLSTGGHPPEFKFSQPITVEASTVTPGPWVDEIDTFFR